MSPDPIPANAELTCTCDTGDEQFYMRIEYAETYAHYTDGTKVVEDAQCPQSGSLPNEDTDQTGWANIYTSDGGLGSSITNGVITCTSPDVPTPSPAPAPSMATPTCPPCSLAESLWKQFKSLHSASNSA